MILEPSEIAAAVPESDKTLSVEAFIPCTQVDDVYFDRSYYLAPSDAAARETFALIRQGMHDRKVAALARTRAVPPCANLADPPAQRRHDRDNA